MERDALLNRRNAIFVGATVIGAVIDQLTKWWIVANIEYRTGEIKVIDGFLSIVHAQNPGAAFGLLGGSGYRLVIFGVFTVVALWVVFDMLRKLPRNDWFVSLALGLILSGAIGNAIDRIRQQYVTDFIRVYTDIPSVRDWLIANFGTYEWPSFNVADTALVIGVAMIALHWFFVERHQKSEPAPAE
jgi:signal peptidase II